MVKAIHHAPMNLAELGHFLPDLSTCLAPLYALLKRACWYWKSTQGEVFQAAKQALQAD